MINWGIEQLDITPAWQMVERIKKRDLSFEIAQRHHKIS